jgi:hypothetical protein
MNTNSLQFPVMKWPFQPVLAKVHSLAGLCFAIASLFCFTRFGAGAFPSWTFLFAAGAFLFLGHCYRKVTYVILSPDILDIGNAYNIRTIFPRAGLIFSRTPKGTIQISRGKVKASISASLVGKKGLEEIFTVLSSER